MAHSILHNGVHCLTPKHGWFSWGLDFVILQLTAFLGVGQFNSGSVYHQR
jgi:hypothetical protein